MFKCPINALYPQCRAEGKLLAFGHPPCVLSAVPATEWKGIPTLSSDKDCLPMATLAEVILRGNVGV